MVRVIASKNPAEFSARQFQVDEHQTGTGPAGILPDMHPINSHRACSEACGAELWATRSPLTKLPSWAGATAPGIRRSGPFPREHSV